MSAYLLDLSHSLLVIDAVLAALLISGLGWGTAWLLRRRSAPLRHGVLFAAVLLTLLSPGLVISLAHLRGGWISVKEFRLPPRRIIRTGLPKSHRSQSHRTATSHRSCGFHHQGQHLAVGQSDRPRHQSLASEIIPPQSQFIPPRPPDSRKQRTFRHTPCGTAPTCQAVPAAVSEELETSASLKTDVTAKTSSRQNPETSKESSVISFVDGHGSCWAWLLGTGFVSCGVFAVGG